MATLTLTLVGRDRTGLVRALAERVAAADGNWLEARMARLAGQFAGVVLIEVADAQAERLVADLKALEAETLRIEVVAGLPEEPPTRSPGLTLSLVGQDHPGIVRDITEALASEGVNIDELTTDIGTAAFSGERLFRATARLSVPADTPVEPLRAALEALAHELMVDVELVEAEPDRA